VHLNAAGIDIGADVHWVAVPEDRDANPIRRFGVFTPDLILPTSNRQVLFVTPKRAAKCAPAECPQTPICSPSILCSVAFARNQRIAALQSSICAGNAAWLLSR
jgi:hypothetical protein